VPRAKYNKPPGPFPGIEHIQRSKFQFSRDQWRKLTKLLPCKLANSDASPEHVATAPMSIKTLADVAVVATEQAIDSHLTASLLISDKPVNAANVRAAIRRLREALKPFIRGWVDDETADITDFADLDVKLEVRDRQIAQLRLPSAQREAVAALCGVIVNVVLAQIASEAGEAVSQYDMLRYLDAALRFARIEHPDFGKHRDRLAKLVFPKDKPSH